VCLSVHACVSKCVCAPICTPVCACVYVCVCVHAHLGVCVHVYTCVLATGILTVAFPVTADAVVLTCTPPCLVQILFFFNAFNYLRLYYERELTLLKRKKLEKIKRRPMVNLSSWYFNFSHKTNRRQGRWPI